LQLDRFEQPDRTFCASCEATHGACAALQMPLFTIGHSNHPLGYFLGLMRLHDIETLCDVRTTPYSQHHRQFNPDLC